MDYKLFGDVKIKERILESNTILNDLLYNFKNKTFNMNVKKPSLNLRSRYFFQMMLKDLNNYLVIGI